MKVFVSYQELESLLKEKSGKAIHLSFADKPDTVRLEYTMYVRLPLFVKKPFTVSGFVTVNGISGMDLNITYTIAKAVDLILNLITKTLDNYIQKTECVSAGQHKNNLILHCDKIAAKAGIRDVEKFSNTIHLHSIHADERGVEVDFSLSV